MTRRSITTASRIDAARRGWETRKANEASRARRFDEVLGENRDLKVAMRALLMALDEDGFDDRVIPAYQAAADLVRS